MNKTLTTMQTNVGNNVQDTSSQTMSLIKTYINDRYTEILRRFKIKNQARLDYTVSSTSGTEDYVLPDDFGYELSVIDKTNNRKLDRTDAQKWVADYYTTIDSTGTVYEYFIYDDVVRKQPTSASTISFTSTSSSDTTQTIYVRGIESVSGTEDYESITLSGTGAAVSTKTYSRILGISKSSATVGIVTGTSNSGAVTVTILGREAMESRCKKIRFASIPNQTLNIELNYIQKNLPLNNSYDYPVLDCAEVLEAGATADAWRYKRQFYKASEWEAIFEKRLANLVYDYENNYSQVHTFNVKPVSRETW